MNTGISLTIYHPKIRLAPFIQGIWAAFNESEVEQHFYSDAAAGLMWIIDGGVTINGECFNEGIIWLPPQKTAYKMVFSCGTKIVGFRFKPAMNTLVCQDYPLSVTQIDGNKTALTDSFSDLLSQFHTTLLTASFHTKGMWHFIVMIYRWLDRTLHITDVDVTKVRQTLDSVSQSSQVAAPVSQRQLERRFKQWLAMTPIYFQRIQRVNHALEEIRNDKHINLANLAIDVGFADQAHMTREFKAIAKITPRQFVLFRHRCT